MQALEEEAARALKKQRLSAAQIDRQLGALLDEVQSTKRRLEARQDELRRKKARRSGESSSSQAQDEAKDEAEAEGEAQDDAMELVVRDFIRRVRLLHVEKNVAAELKAIHVLLSKYSKQIDKNLCSDIASVCRSSELDEEPVMRMIAEYLYHDGQIEAADAVCKEGNVDLSPMYRECFVEMHEILAALKKRDMQPALDWARKHRTELQQLQIDVEFELVRLKYVDILETSPDVLDAVNFAHKELSFFHTSHAEEVGVLMSCVLYKDRIEESPYKNLFSPDRWQDIYDAIIRACCRLRNVPYRSYLDTCLSAGISALPAMRKFMTVMANKVTDWGKMEELPVEIPIPKELRFHSVFSCPVSKEESTPTNPPMLLKCGHVICRACVKRISSNMTRCVGGVRRPGHTHRLTPVIDATTSRFKCPTCPMEQTESETRELFF